MQLPQEFIKLPFRFDAERLNDEVNALPDDAWIPHPDKFYGNSSVPLISVEGEVNNDFCGPMAPTDSLQASPYIQQVIASFNQVVGRSRLMRLSAGAEVPLHTDTSYHWQNRVRIHIPVITDEGVQFYCGEEQTHMGEGETWLLDTWKYHKVENNGETERVHLVIDTAGDSQFWRQVENQLQAHSTAPEAEVEIPFEQRKPVTIPMEKHNAYIIMPCGEVDRMCVALIENILLTNPDKEQQNLLCTTILQELQLDWRCLWYLHGEDPKGWLDFKRVRQRAFDALNNLPSEYFIDNGTTVAEALFYCLIQPLINVKLMQKP